ncbi:hypothetical protein EYC80_001710 [Monilinia laxa]|uniref:Uncharacterized protein n=1 Tax=Monilinia laxa TaxID=61186 RepID=A0A5N6K5R1_MONLA|nr:hypothetical protein EYC80_001710 [Monilinia laxa]
MYTLNVILPNFLLILPRTVATVESDFPQPSDFNSNQEQRDFDSETGRAFTIHIIISAVILVAFILVMISLTMIASRRRQERRTQIVGNVYNGPGVGSTAVPPYKVGNDVYLPVYSYEPARGETVVAQSSEEIAQPAPAHLSKDVV